ncbi:hypothetical protein [Asanoa siamensis]|uniref:Uncharacterized protein n=1 Tax=Asanoa siamensis TaxID=926357 RepID=A0ABQ4CS90_9ACTN|nr:hypothetical protein [Asanoa siamensis]GIF74121.1 hypothetical protein Asi02nite_36390 [Asanoa siamensis]
MNHADRGREPVVAVCAASYFADLVPAHAFVFRLPASDSRFTVYAQAGDRYLTNAEYTLLLVPGETVPLLLAVEDVAFLRHCLRKAADRWREVEPTPAGYRAARQRFADELDRVEHLVRLLDSHLDGASGHRDGDTS